MIASPNLLAYKSAASVQVLVLPSELIRQRGVSLLAFGTRQLEATPGEMLKDPAGVYATAEERAAAYRQRREKAATSRAAAAIPALERYAEGALVKCTVRKARPVISKHFCGTIRPCMRAT